MGAVNQVKGTEIQIVLQLELAVNININEALSIVLAYEELLMSEWEGCYPHLTICKLLTYKTGIAYIMLFSNCDTNRGK